WLGEMTTGIEISKNGLLWGADGKTLYAVGKPSHPGTYGRLYVFRPPPYVAGAPEQLVPSDGSWSGIKAGPPPYWEGERPGKSYTKDISVTNDRLEPLPGRITIRYYLPGQAVQSLLSMTNEKGVTLSAADGGAVLT